MGVGRGREAGRQRGNERGGEGRPSPRGGMSGGKGATSGPPHLQPAFYRFRLQTHAIHSVFDTWPNVRQDGREQLIRQVVQLHLPAAPCPNRLQYGRLVCHGLSQARTGVGAELSRVRGYGHKGWVQHNTCNRAQLMPPVGVAHE